MKRFGHKRKQRVLWYGEENQDFLSQGFGQAHNVPPQTAFFPIMNVDNSDVGLSLGEELTLAGPPQGILQGTLVGQAWSLKRLLAHMTIVVNLQPNDAASGLPQARYIGLRMGIFKGMTDQSGALQNGRDFLLEGTGANVTTLRTAATTARQNRFVWMYERTFCNPIAGDDRPFNNGTQGVYDPLYGSNAAGPWNTVGNFALGPARREVEIDLHNLGVCGPEERWFLAGYAWDFEAVLGTMFSSGKVDLRFHWNPRLLIARSSAFRKKPGV